VRQRRRETRQSSGTNTAHSGHDSGLGTRTRSRLIGRTVNISSLPYILSAVLPSYSHVLQRLVWFNVHLLLVGRPIPVSYTQFASCDAIQICFSSLTSQVLENIRRQSVEGLALPFLANWLLGTINRCINSISKSSGL